VHEADEAALFLRRRGRLMFVTRLRPRRRRSGLAAYAQSLDSNPISHMAVLRVVHVFGSDYPGDRAWDLLAWCHEAGADEFTVAAIVSPGFSQTALEPFDRAAAAYRLSDGPRRHLSGPPDSPLTFATPLWSLGPETVVALRLAFPRGLFDYYPGTDAWFEDLEVYRGAELMFGIITHEHEGVVRVRDEELVQLDAYGFRYRAAGQWVGY